MKVLIRFLIRRIPRTVLIRLSYFFSWLFRIWYRGNNVECPVCGKSFRKFMPYGVMSRDNALCPNCLSLERHRLLWLFLKKETDFFSSSLKVLHIAPEQCFLNRFMGLKNLDYTTADLESPIADLHFDLHDIPLSDNQYDFIICNHVMEHVRDDKRVLGELLRILKTGGRAILQVPMDYSRTSTFEDPSVTRPSEREKLFGQRDHVRVYGLDYPERLRASGFIVEEIAYPLQLGKDIVSKHKLPEEEIIYLNIKPEV